MRFTDRRKAWKQWWSTAHSTTVTHRFLKWIWVFPGIPISLYLRNSIAYLVFISIYTVITGHWSAEENGKTQEKAEQSLESTPDATNGPKSN